MDETADQIEARIDRTRERIGSNLRELEQKVDDATDWREQFRERPYVLLGAAFIGGTLLGTALGARSRGRVRAGDVGLAAVPRHAGIARTQALELWETVQHALVGLAATRVKEYIGQLVPGFDEHLQRVEQQTPRATSARTS